MITKKFTLYWLTGKKEVITGNNLLDACMKAGYSNGTIKALDFYSKDENNDYLWNKVTRNWDMTEEAKTRLFFNYKPIKQK
jgi:hypothetical protein